MGAWGCAVRTGGVLLALGPLVSGSAVALVDEEVAPAVDPGRWMKANRSKIEKLAKAWWQARPATRFDDWDGERRAELVARADALGALPEFDPEDERVSLDALVASIWKPLAKSWGDGVGKSKKGKVSFETPYGDAWFYLVKGKAKRGERPPLVLGMHGGGEGAGDAAEARGNWAVDGAVGVYPQGIHLVGDTWNTVEGERFLLTLIEHAKARYDVDPDRVYATGFSMGGTGSWFLAGRHADLLAGAMPCAGVLMASPRSQVASADEVYSLQHGLVPNVRNLAMWYFIGLDDTNCMPGTYLYVERMLEELRAKDPGGYANVHFKSYPGLAHAFPPGEPAAGLDFLLEQRRVTFPEIVVWEYVADPFPQYRPDEARERLVKHDFYWISCADPVDFQSIRAEREGNLIRLTTRGTADGLKGITIRLNPTMVDVTQEVVVEANGKQVWRGRPVPTLADVLLSLDARLDRSMVFDRRIEL